MAYESAFANGKKKYSKLHHEFYECSLNLSEEEIHEFYSRENVAIRKIQRWYCIEKEWFAIIRSSSAEGFFALSDKAEAYFESRMASANQLNRNHKELLKLFEKHGSGWMSNSTSTVEMVYIGKKLVDSKTWGIDYECGILGGSDLVSVNVKLLELYDEIKKRNEHLNNIFSFMQQVVEDRDDVSDSDRVQGFRDILLNWSGRPVTIDDEITEMSDRCQYIPRFGSVFTESEARFASMQ